MTNSSVLTSDLRRKKLKKVKNTLFNIFRFILLAGICYYILYPFLVKLLLSVMEKGDLYDSTVGIIPRHFTLENLQKVFKYLDYPKSFFMTLAVSLLTTAAQLASCTLVGYGFARYDFPFKKLLFGAVLFILIIPPSTIIIPMYLNYRFFDFSGGLLNMLTGGSVNLIGSVWTFIISGLTCMGYKCGLYIYLIRQYYRSVPKELEEAAMLDGAGHFSTFTRVMLPNAKSILVVVGMLSFVWQWTDIFYSSWFMKTDNLLSRKLSSLVMNVAVKESVNGVSSMDTNYETLLNATGCMLLILPLVIFYILAQKSFVQSVERSGIVG